jgi:tRNA-splicing ligase RtcB (3'-phosphate/5'-hydroxy nucleic acid ligase)
MKRVISDTKVPVKIWADDLEAEAEKQLRNMANMPFIYRHVAAMPDAHAGRGSTVGTVIATQGAIIPAAVGVDIGCGMCALKLPFKVDLLGGSEKLAQLRHSIERSIPTGMHGNKSTNERVETAFKALGDVSQTAQSKLRQGVFQKALYALGTLGGGNHFIEICADKEDNAWIMLHSGSRNIGKCLAEIHIDKAKDLMKQYFISLPDPDLAYLAQHTPEFKEYLHDLMWGQQFAMANRNEMMDRTLREVLYHVGMLDQYNVLKESLFRVNCHHNYTAIENHSGKNVYVTRKGAVSARVGEYGIIPGSMGTRSYIVKGLGNSESFCSCSHGAGRRMSRTKAREVFTIEDLKAQTAGIECRKDNKVLDEIPGSYKDIDVVMDNQKDLVEPVAELRQLICIKGD